MKDIKKTKQELIQELDVLRQRVAALELSELARKRAEEALLESTTRYDELVRRIPVGVFALRIRADGSMAFEYESPQLCKILGLDEGALLRDVNLAFAIARPEDRDNLIRSTREAAANLNPFRWEGRFVVRGDTRWVRIESDPTRLPSGDSLWNGVISDITDRKRAEGALQESEERLQLLFDEAPVGYHEVDMEGRVIRINQTELDLLGYCVEDVLGRPIWRLCVDEEAVIKAFKDKIAGKVPPGRAFERSYRRKDGTLLPVLSEDRILKDEGGRISGIRTTIQGITERKRAEEALQEQLLFLQQLLDAIPVPVFYKDRQGVFRGCNVGYEKFVGLSKEQVVGRTVFGVAPRDLANVYHQADQELFNQPGVQVYETSFLHADGDRHDIIFNKATYVGTDGCVVGLVGVILDITDRKQIEKALRKSEERFRELFDHAPVSYHEIDSEGCIARVNHTELEMLGYAYEEMIGQPIWKFNAEEEPARKRILGKLAGDISPSKGYELTYRRKDGAAISLLSEDRLILDSEGRITGLRGIFQDITERKRAEETMRRMAQRFHIMLSAQHYGILVVDENDRIEFLNETFREQYTLAQGPSTWIGYRAEDFIALILPAYADVQAYVGTLAG